jgi:hypothetical protein
MVTQETKHTVWYFATAPYKAFCLFYLVVVIFHLLWLAAPDLRPNACLEHLLEDGLCFATVPDILKGQLLN